MRTAAALVNLIALCPVFVMQTAAAMTSSASFQINFPQTLKVDGGYTNSEALFGTPSYGGAITAQLIYAVDDACTGLDGSAGFPTNEGNWESPFMLMVNRGDCTFVSKVREAQRKGAAAVVIADNKCLCSDLKCVSDPGVDCEHSPPIMADDGSGGDITIPAVMIFRGDADRIKNAMISESVTVLATLAWDLPSPDDVVEWDMWTSSIDDDAQRFKEEFHDTIRELGASQFFTPHYYLVNGWRLGCTGDSTGECGKQCVSGGRYCLPDPDGDFEKGLSGADVVRENVRRMCIWEVASEEDPGLGDKWWLYVRRAVADCGSETLFPDVACHEKLMRSVGLDVAKVNACVTKTGDLDVDAPNDKLNQLLSDVTAYGVVKLPEVLVNGVHMRGHVSTEAVLTAICSGYLAGTEPAICACVGIDPAHAMECVRGGGGGGGGGWSTFGVLWLVVLIVGAMGGGAYFYWQKTQNNMRNQVRGILAEYMPLEDNMGSSALLDHSEDL